MTQIVVGVDGSEHSQLALRWAAREARLRGGDLGGLTAVLVWDLFNQLHADGSRRFDPDYDDTKADAALLATLQAALGAEAAASVVRRPVCDVPAQGLLGATGAGDLLVVGARGLGGFRGLLLGSVSQQCLHHAPGPVAVEAVHSWEMPMIYGPVGLATPYDTAGIENAARRLVDEVVDTAVAQGGETG